MKAAWLVMVITACDSLPPCATDGCPAVKAAECGSPREAFTEFVPTCTTNGCVYLEVPGACADGRTCGANESFPQDVNCIDVGCSLAGCPDEVMGCASDTVALHATGTCNANACGYGDPVAVDCTAVDYVDAAAGQTHCEGDNLITYTGAHYCADNGCAAKPVALDCGAMGMVCNPDRLQCLAPSAAAP